jgi:hypothetical protein
MKKLIYLFSLILLTLVFESCDSYAPLAYQPTTPNIPLLEEAGDFQAMGALGLNHVELHGAVSPIKHFSLMGNVYFIEGGGKNNSFGIGTNMRINRDIFVELYGLTGIAERHVNYEKEYSPFMSSNNYRNVHISNFKYAYNALQLNAGYKCSPSGSLIFSTKFTRTTKYNFDYIKYSYSDQGSGSWSQTSVKEEHFSHGIDVLDISVGYAYRWKILKLQYQVTYPIHIDRYDAPNEEDLYITPFFGSLTVGFDFDNPRRRIAAPKGPSTP